KRTQYTKFGKNLLFSFLGFVFFVGIILISFWLRCNSAGYGCAQTTAASGNGGWRASGWLTKFQNGKKIRRAQRPRIGNQHPEEDRFVSEEACQKNIKSTNVAFCKRLNFSKYSEPTRLGLRL